MAIFKEVYGFLEEYFPKTDSEPWDCDGLDICVDQNAEINKIVLALDITSTVISYAKEIGANLIITHHPVLFDKINVIDESDIVGKKIISLISSGISSISYHTRLDKHEGGVNDSLCDKLGLVADYKICNGIVNVCSVEETEFETFSKKVEGSIPANIKKYENCKTVKKVAVCGGGGKSCIPEVVRNGVDTYITGEVDHMSLIDAKECGLNLILGTHYGTEALVLPYLKKVIENRFSEIPVFIKYTEEFSK